MNASKDLAAFFSSEPPGEKTNAIRWLQKKVMAEAVKLPRDFKTKDEWETFRAKIRQDLPGVIGIPCFIFSPAHPGSAPMPGLVWNPGWLQDKWSFLYDQIDRLGKGQIFYYKMTPAKIKHAWQNYRSRKLVFIPSVATRGQIEVLVEELEELKKVSSV